MAKMSCFSFLLGGDKKRSKVIRSKVAYAKKATGSDCPPKVTPVEFMDMPGTVHDVGNAAARDTNVFARTPAEPALQERDASNEDSKAASKRDSSHAGLAVAGEDSSPAYGSGDSSKNSAVSAAGESSGIGNMSPAASPELQRSCSNIETGRSVLPAEEFDDLPAAKSLSYGDLEALPSGTLLTTTPSGGAPGASPTASSCSASPRNDACYAMDAVTAREPKNKEVIVEDDPGLPRHWAALSPLDRVSAWVNSLQKNGSPFHVVDEEEEDGAVTEHDARAAWCSEIEECPSTTAAGKHRARRKRRAAEEAVQAGSVVPALNAVASVAHVSGMGLKAVPMIAAFSSLRAVNLSANFIVHISPGSLPSGLRSLDLSRNKIASIEGLRELTRLRVLNLSYNRISRIGHGLSSCTAIRELYLAGNKISDVEGLHRLLKLAVLDASFNRIITARSLGQLVANYASLRALNLVGNPVQANVGDDTLRKAVEGLLPRLEYLNKQALKPQRAREVAKDSVAQAALGNGGGARSRRAARRVSQSPGSSGKSRGGRDGGGSRRGSRSRSKTRGASQGGELPRQG